MNYMDLRYIIEIHQVYLGNEDIDDINFDYPYALNSFTLQMAKEKIDQMVDMFSKQSEAEGKGRYKVKQVGKYAFAANNDEKEWVIMFVLVPVIPK